MNKIGFLFSGIISLIGLITIILTKVVQLVMPYIGRAAFQAAAAGIYIPENYNINFSFIQNSSIFLIILGIVLSMFFYRSESNN
ncbi:MAG: hypothetical protein K9K32_01760 [Halanaerobiales bacterium]|nr:hypothetical protein [Halanaerobiales bacterium]